MVRKLLILLRLYILRINIFIFPDKREVICPERSNVMVPEICKNKGITVRKNEELFSDRNVLIGVFRNVAQFETCISKSFYYIPYELVEGFEATLSYIALYQSKNLFGYDAGIRYYGKINSYEVLSRDKITEIPTENEGIYCRFEVECWETLENVIYPREVGFIREFTTMYLLMNSREVPQLFAESEIEFNLYNAVSLAVECRQKLKFMEYTLFTRRGYLLVFKGETLSHFYPEKEIRIRPGATVKNMIKDMNLL